MRSHDLFLCQFHASVKAPSCEIRIVPILTKEEEQRVNWEYNTGHSGEKVGLQHRGVKKNKKNMRNILGMGMG